ncbi:MAG: hypothetical protein JOZ10_04185 [Acidobacteria bacterium]|nr:hypothetical protein [Acidobacteriota bacterium]
MHGISAEDKELALAVLEHDQLAKAKDTQYARRKLKGGESVVLWSLRLYLIFMLAVVLYQIVSGAR